MDYEQGIQALKALVEKQIPQKIADFSSFEHRLLKCKEHEQLHGRSEKNDVERSEVLYELTIFTQKHFAIAFIDLCRSKAEPVYFEEAEKTNRLGISFTYWREDSEIIVGGIGHRISGSIINKKSRDGSILYQEARAQQRTTNRRVMLKQVQISKMNVSAPNWKEALDKEKRLLNKLEQQGQPGFPRSLIEEPPHSFINNLVLSTFNGRTWQQDFGGTNTPLDTWRIRSLLKSTLLVCSRLKVLHREYVAHRALTPANIIQTDPGQIYLQDVGLAAWNIVPGEGPEAYRAPEQSSTRRNLGFPGPQTDIYQLGMILHHLITGRLPLADMPVLPLRTWNEGLSASVDNVIQQALASNPKERWRNIADFEQALKRAMESR